MRNLLQRRRELRGPKADATDGAGIATGAGGVVAADTGRAGTEAATMAVDAEADGRSRCWFPIGSCSRSSNELRE